MVNNFLASLFDAAEVQIKKMLEEIEIATPDSRWQMFQRWLEDYPQIHEWVYLSTDDAFLELRNLAAEEISKRLKVPGVILREPLGKTVANFEAPIKKTIEQLQTLYRERAGETEKEIKNVRPARQVERRSRKNPRGGTTRPKRTDQT